MLRFECDSKECDWQEHNITTFGIHGKVHVRILTKLHWLNNYYDGLKINIKWNICYDFTVRKSTVQIQWK